MHELARDANHIHHLVVAKKGHDAAVRLWRLRLEPMEQRPAFGLLRAAI